MTISSTTRKAGPFTGNGTANTFPFAFKVFAATDVVVVKTTTATDVATELVMGTDYTVSLNADQNASPGGNVVLTAGNLPAGYTLALTSDVLELQPTDFTNQGGFYPSVLNQSLDRLTILVQQTQEQVDRSLKFPLGDATSPNLPAGDALKGAVLAFDPSTGAPIAGPTIFAVGTVAAASANIQTVATNIGSVNTVAGSIGNVNNVGGSIANVNTVAGSIGNVNTVAGNIAAVNTTATNISAVVAAPASASSASTSASAAAVSAASASTSAGTALAAAQASGSVLFYDTMAAANAALAGLPDQQIVDVMSDESRGFTRSRYRKVSGVYVFKLALADVTTVALTERDGFGRRLRNTETTLGCLDRQAYGPNGPGNPRDLPKAITASQAGTTVTASSAIFTKDHVGNIIVWGTGEEAIITDVNNEASAWVAITTCTVDRSQTVASGAANIDAKPFVYCYFGDSIAYDVAIVDIREWYRAYGFGGYIFRPNGIDTTSLSIGEAAFGGTATEVVNGVEYSTFPWSAYWNLPTGGSVAVNFISPFSSGTEREYRFGLKPENMLSDTCLVVWRRGAGALTVERRRMHDAAWELVDTIADTSTGARAFNFKKYSHALRFDWVYRVTCTSGTVKLAQISMLNRATPGFVVWPLNRGGVDISNFDGLPSADLAELVQLNMPDFRTVFSADANFGTDPAVYLATLTTDRNLWAAAAPRTDNVWLATWTVRPVDDAGGLKQRAWNSAMQQLALTNDECFISFDTLYGDYYGNSSAKGWLRDSVHSTKKGQAITSHVIDRALSLTEHPLAAEGRNVNARAANIDTLTVRGRDFTADMNALKRRNVHLTRGAKWVQGSQGFLQAPGALGGAIGTGDFTLMLDMDVLASAAATQYIASLSGNAALLSGASGVWITRETHQLNFYFVNASGNTYKYQFDFFGVVYGGARRTIHIRSDVAKGRLDLFVDGLPSLGVVGSVVPGTGSALGTWSGIGQDFGVPQATNSNSCSFYYGAMAWRSSLSDSEIYQNAITGDIVTTVPDFAYDFSEQGGRVVLDKSGNGKDALFLSSNPQQYSIGSGPTWKGTLRQFSPPWVATLGATSVLIAGDDVTHQNAGGRDYLLPATPKVGDVVRVTKQQAVAVRITQPALHQIKTGAGGTVGTNATTIGATGSITIVGAYDSVTLKCVKASAGVSYEWAVVAASSALTWT